MPEFKHTYEIENVDCTTETDAAILVMSDDIGEVWVPKSQIDDSSEVCGEYDSGTLVISEWLAEERGWY